MFVVPKFSAMHWKMLRHKFFTVWFNTYSYSKGKVLKYFFSILWKIIFQWDHLTLAESNFCATQNPCTTQRCHQGLLRYIFQRKCNRLCRREWFSVCRFSLILCCLIFILFFCGFCFLSERIFHYIQLKRTGFSQNIF